MKLLPWDYGVRSLGRAPGRFVLGAAGSLLVVLLVLAAAAFVRGLGGSLRNSGEDRNVVLLGAGSEESLERSEIAPGVAGIAAASIPGIRERMGVAYVSPEAHVAVSVRVEEDAAAPKYFANFRGVTPPAFLVHSRVRIVEGRAPGPGEMLVGRLAAARLGVPDEALEVGDRLWLDDQAWTVSGRFAAPGTMMEAEIWVPLQDLLVATTKEKLSSVVVTLDEAGFDDVDLFAKQRLDLELIALREDDYYAAVFAFFRPIRMMVWAIALLVAAGAFFGGLNTMYAAFAARVRELASLRVLGYTRFALLLGLVQESVLIAATGSLVATAVGLVALDGLTVRVSMGAFGMHVDGGVVMLAMGAGLLLGLLGALPPAWRCLRIPVAEALRAA